MKKVRHNPVLKKILGESLYRKYQNSQNDEELTAVYHEMLDRCPAHETTAESIIYAMIGFSTGVNINAKVLVL